MNKILDNVYYDNAVQQYLIAFGIIIFGILLVRLFKRAILTRVEKLTMNTRTRLDTFIVRNFDKYGIPAIYILTTYFGISYLNIPERVEDILKVALTFALTVLGIRLISNVVQAIMKSYLRRQKGGEDRVKQLSGLMLIINIAIWMIGLLFLFSNLGFDVSAVIAGLGIGGIAIALAAQNILGDLFNYFVILFDRPFEVGDFLILDDKLGNVEYIGVKTTRLRSLSGEQLIFSNADMTQSRIRNYKRMFRRRVVFEIGVTYQTSLENLKKMPKILRDIVEDQQDVVFDRAHFASYGDSSLKFEIVYYVEDPDYNVYMDRQQDINFRIYEELEKIGVEIAYPTRTLYINSGKNGAETSINQE